MIVSRFAPALPRCAQSAPAPLAGRAITSPIAARKPGAER
jgi:hypothetical protein